MTDCNCKLMGINDSREIVIFTLAALSFDQEVVVLTEKNSFQCPGAIKELVVRPTGGAIFLGRKDIDPAQT